MEYIQAKKIDLVINIPKNFNKEELTNGYTIRRGAVEFAIPLITNRQIAMRLAESLFKYNYMPLKIKSMDEYKIK
jgi:carbamoyl-phosphate synthase large subunit